MTVPADLPLPPCLFCYAPAVGCADWPDWWGHHWPRPCPADLWPPPHCVWNLPAHQLCVICAHCKVGDVSKPHAWEQLHGSQRLCLTMTASSWTF